jgi:hypothetical protein
MIVRQKIGEFELVDHGIEHPDYFQGCGVAFTQFAFCATGIGANPADALEDLLEMVTQTGNGWDTEDLEARILKDVGLLKMPNRPLAKGETYYHISLRWNSAE